MEENGKNRAKKVFAETWDVLAQKDPEFLEIAANFSQEDAAGASHLTEKERMLCIFSALLGCQGLGEFRNMLHTALDAGVPSTAIKEDIY